jgi:hypothetical protein
MLAAGGQLMSHQSAIRQRTRLPFSQEEWALLVRLPGRVVVAATSAHPDPARRSVAEGLAGIDAIAAGRASASRLVREVVAAIYAEYGDDDQPVADELTYRLLGSAGVLDDCRRAGRLLAERAGREDADGYRHWLESIAARVCQAARTGGLFRVGGEPVSRAERQFLSDLGAAFDG